MLRAELANLVASLGQPVEFRQAKAPQAVIQVAKALSQSTAKATDAIVNAYGVNGREFVFTQASLAVPPERFDVVAGNGERYVIDAVVPLHEHGSGLIVGWRCYVKGK